MATVLNFILRLVLLAAALVFAASMAVAFVLMLASWGVRAAWAKLTGRPVVPFIVRIDPRSAFERMYRASERSDRTPRSDAGQSRHVVGDVTDVEPKPPVR